MIAVSISKEWLTYGGLVWFALLFVLGFIGSRAARNGFFKDEAPSNPNPPKRKRHLRRVK